MAKPLVSVSIPVFNAAATIGETIASVQAQDVSDLEMVVVDDGSTDDTVAAVEALARQDPRIRLVRQENAGCPAARGNGFVQARGTYVATLDGDDLWPPTKLREQLDALQRDPDAVVIGGVRRFRTDNGDVRWLRETMPFPWRDRDDYLKRLLCAENEEMVLFNTFCAKREHMLEDNYDPAVETGHDWEVWLRLAAKHRFIPLRSVHGFYRKHASSATRKRPHQKAIRCHIGVLRKHLPVSGLSRREQGRILATQILRMACRHMNRGDLGTAWSCLARGAGVPASYADFRFYKLLLQTAKRQFHPS